MNEKEICKKIFELITPCESEMKAPMAFVNVEIGFDLHISEEELQEELAAIRWDTELSSVDISLTRKPSSDKKDTSIKVISVSGFADEKGNVPIIKIDKEIIP